MFSKINKKCEFSFLWCKLKFCVKKAKYLKSIWRKKCGWGIEQNVILSEAKSDRALSLVTLGRRTLPPRQKITTCSKKWTKKKKEYWLKKRETWVGVKWTACSHFWHLSRWLVFFLKDAAVVSTNTGAQDSAPWSWKEKKIVWNTCFNLCSTLSANVRYLDSYDHLGCMI